MRENVSAAEKWGKILEKQLTGADRDLGAIANRSRWIRKINGGDLLVNSFGTLGGKWMGARLNQNYPI